MSKFLAIVGTIGAFLLALAIWSRFVKKGSPGPPLLKGGINALTRLIRGEEGTG